MKGQFQWNLQINYLSKTAFWEPATHLSQMINISNYDMQAFESINCNFIMIKLVYGVAMCSWYVIGNPRGSLYDFSIESTILLLFTRPWAVIVILEKKLYAMELTVAAVLSYHPWHHFYCRHFRLHSSCFWRSPFYWIFY